MKTWRIGLAVLALGALALAVARERERGSILQIYISPIRAWEFLGGKLLPYAAIAFMEMLLLLAAGRLWYTHLFPARHFMEIARGIDLNGVGLERLWPNAALLLAYGTVVLTLASLRFRKRGT